MGIKKPKIKAAADAGKAVAERLEKGKQAVAETADQNGDGKLDLKDFSAAAEKAGVAVRRATDTLKEGGRHLGEKWDQSKIVAERRALCPIFAEDLDKPEFQMTKLIRIAEPDKRRAEAVACRGAIGYESVQKGLRVIQIYRVEAKAFGLAFYPDAESEVYYVDPSDRDRYIALEDYFHYLKVARINELQRIAQTLGAKHFKVTYKEQKKDQESVKAGGKLKAGKSGIGDAHHELAQKAFSAVEIAAEMECIGHDPERPALVYLKNEPAILSLIERRLDNNPITRETFTLHLSNSSGIKKHDAVKIDAALSAMKCTGDMSIASEAQKEELRIFEYEIDF